MKRIVYILAIGLACVLATVTTVTADPQTPVPPAAAVASAEKVLRETYKADYAKIKPAEQVEFARKLLQAGEVTDNDPAGRYVTYQEARTIAAKAGDLALALDAVTATCREFEVNRMELVISTLETAAKSPSSPDNIIVEVVLAEVDHQILADNYPTVTHLLKLASDTARIANIPTLTVTVNAKTRDVEAIRQGFEATESDRNVLAKSPNNPVAAGRVGRFLCLIKGDWEAGLPLLAKGVDETLKATATKDLARPSDVATQVELADAWYNLGEGYDLRERTEGRFRAYHWYQQASPFSTGLTKDRIDKRIEELGTLAVTRLSRVGPSGWCILFRSDNPAIWNTDTVRPGNQFAVALTRAPIDTEYLKLTETKSGDYVIIEMARLRLADRTDQYGYGWIGTKSHMYKADHLGIYDKSWTKIDSGQIEVFNIPKRAGYRGWGFGHRRLKDDVQGYSWNGKAIAKTIFEIAVKTTALTPEESKHLLKKKK